MFSLLDGFKLYKGFWNSKIHLIIFGAIPILPLQIFSKRRDVIFKRMIGIKFYSQRFFYGTIFSTKIFNLSCTVFVRTY